MVVSSNYLDIDQHSTFWVQADFTEELLRGRFVDEHFTPAMLTNTHWQVFTLFIAPTFSSCRMKHMRFVVAHSHAHRVGR